MSLCHWWLCLQQIYVFTTLILKYFLCLQVQSFGCSNFALLFDDIDAELCPEDEEVYDSAGHAQSALTNMLYVHLGQPKVFLFCPTGNDNDMQRYNNIL